jgi:hypothetical protein
MQKLQKSKLLITIAIILIGLSGVFFGFILVVPFLPVSLATKGVFVPALVVSGEIAWWAGVALLGKKVFEKYKKYLNPRNWFTRKIKTLQSNSQNDQGLLLK